MRQQLRFIDEIERSADRGTGGSEPELGTLA
jgi:hypothetical protein